MGCAAAVADGTMAQARTRKERFTRPAFASTSDLRRPFTGVPAGGNLAPCATAAASWAATRRRSEPLVPVDLVVDHSVMVDHYGKQNSLDLNMKLEFQRNRGERYEFMKWGMQAFDTFGVVPPGFGIVHQVNLEYLARGVHASQGRYLLPRHPGGHRQPHHHDQRHRRGGLGRGRHRGRRPPCWASRCTSSPRMWWALSSPASCAEGVTATDLVLTVTERLRQHKVVASSSNSSARHAPWRCRPRHHRQHGAQIRRHHGLLPGR